MQTQSLQSADYSTTVLDLVRNSIENSLTNPGALLEAGTCTLENEPGSGTRSSLQSEKVHRVGISTGKIVHDMTRMTREASARDIALIPVVIPVGTSPDSPGV